MTPTCKKKYAEFGVGWLCFASHQQRGHLETAPQFTVPCEGRGARYLHFATGIEPRGVALHSITQPLRHASPTLVTVPH